MTDILDNSATAVTLPFGDGEYTFHLTWKYAVEWEETMQRSLFATFSALASGHYASLQCYRQLILLGLIGGGLAPVEALRKVKTYVEERPLSESHLTALAVAGAALFGSDGMDAAIAGA